MNTPTSPIEALFRRMRFLVIDGSTERADTIERYLLLTGAFLVRRAATPLLALRILQDKRTPSDCVICQLDMEPMSGLEFLANLRGGRYGGRPLCDIKFMLVSRQPVGHLEAEFKRLRADGHYVGEFDRDEFCAAVYGALGPHGIASVDANSTASTPRLKVAHLRQQGVDLVIAPVDTAFGHQPPDRQLSMLESLRKAAAQARLNGEVIPVWDIGDGRMGFIAPPGYHPYFQSISLDFVRANLNRDMIAP